jgi:hypothetical protein
MLNDIEWHAYGEESGSSVGFSKLGRTLVKIRKKPPIFQSELPALERGSNLLRSPPPKSPPTESLGAAGMRHRRALRGLKNNRECIGITAPSKGLCVEDCASGLFKVLSPVV